LFNKWLRMGFSRLFECFLLSLWRGIKIFME
jgi:hypothetical protein